MRLLIIDNYDSFTYNLWDLAARVFGTEPLVIKNNEAWNGQADAVIISPGPGTPECECDLGLSRRVLEQAPVPILGVCLGHQAICHGEGGRIVRAPIPVHGYATEVFHDASALFTGIPSPFRAVRYHSLACAEPVPQSLTRTAWTSDGTVMGVEHRSRPMWGVQFHPESIGTEYGWQIMGNFRDLVESYWRDLA